MMMRDPLHDRDPFPGAGDLIGDNYVLRRVVREGPVSTVFEATRRERRSTQAPAAIEGEVPEGADRDPAGGLVAFKFLNRELVRVESARARFLREAAAASAIESDHVVRILEVGEAPGEFPFIVMEWLQGIDLDELLERHGDPGLAVPRAVHFTMQLLTALQEAHWRGIVHRDVKLANCFVLSGDPQDYLKVLDFGVSKRFAQSVDSITRAGAALGTPGYMAPEQAQSPRDADARSDLYSVGVVLYALLSGRLPIPAEGRRVGAFVKSLVNDEPIPLASVAPSVPRELSTVVHMALAKRPALRPQTAIDFARLIGQWGDERSSALLQAMEAFAAREDRPTGVARAVAVHSASPSSPDGETTLRFTVNRSSSSLPACPAPTLPPGSSSLVAFSVRTPHASLNERDDRQSVPAQAAPKPVRGEIAVRAPLVASPVLGVERIAALFGILAVASLVAVAIYLSLVATSH